MNAQQGARVRAPERVVRSRTGDPVSAHPAPSGSEWPPPSPIQPSLSSLTPAHADPFPLWSFLLSSFHTQNLPPPNPSPSDPSPSDPSPSDPSPSDPSELSPSEPARLRSFPTLIIPLSDPSLSGLSTPLRFFHPQVFPPETLPLHILPASEPSTQIIPPSGPCLSELPHHILPPSDSSPGESCHLLTFLPSGPSPSDLSTLRSFALRPFPLRSFPFISFPAQNFPLTDHSALRFFPLRSFPPQILPRSDFSAHRAFPPQSLPLSHLSPSESSPFRTFPLRYFRSPILPLSGTLPTWILPPG
ncbi:neuron-specific vesicular protein calcyon isoform X1 [Macaca fascicularis]|uniref:neuron-specific vesicular protein calcyon isoform X1 n=1 Tax=Macaca fascicularis TaxID=9541 RepID=UPI0032B08C74